MDPIVSMIGRLGTEAEHRTSRHGNEYITFRLATTQRVQRDGEWTDGDTTWVSVRCYRQLAVNAAFSLRKGDPVVVVGRLRVETWMNDAGVQREKVVLNADSVGHDLTRGTSKFTRGERRQHIEPAAVREFEGEVVDPETGAIVDLAGCELAIGSDLEGFCDEPVPEEAGLAH